MSMSRYESLCTALRDLREKFQRSRTECYEFAGTLIAELREFLGAEEDAVSFYATLGSWSGKKVDGPSSAMNLGDDTFWHFGVAIDVVEEFGQMPCHTVGFEFRLKKIADHFLLVLHPEGPQFTISAAAPSADLAALYEHLYQHTLRRYQGAYQGYFLEGEPNKRFGF
jgi:hypothetical protein